MVQVFGCSRLYIDRGRPLKGQYIGETAQKGSYGNQPDLAWNGLVKGGWRKEENSLVISCTLTFVVDSCPILYIVKNRVRS